MIVAWRKRSRRRKTAATAPKAFDTPQQAADALIKAAGDYDVPELLAIFGPDGEDFVASGDPVQDKNNASAFAKEAAAKNSIAVGQVQSEPGNHHCRRRRVAASGSPGEEERQMVFRRQGRATGDPLPPHRRQRTRRHHRVPRLC